MAIFTWSMDMYRDQMDLAYHANLTTEQVSELLEAIDVLAHAAGRSQGWSFGHKDEDVVIRTVREMQDMVVSTGVRAEVNGDSIGVAWYDAPGTDHRMLDRDMLAWM